MTSSEGTSVAETRAAICRVLEEARRDLLAGVEGFPDEKMTVPAVGEWSVKDILAHLASWEEQILPDLRRVREGRQPALAAFNEADVDQWNALLVGLRRAFPLSQVRQKLAHYRSAIIEALDSLPHFAICAGHDRRHAEHIRHWRQQEGV